MTASPKRHRHADTAREVAGREDVEDAAAFAAAFVRKATSPEDPWTSRRATRVLGSEHGFDAGALDDAVDALVETGDVVYWHGLVAPRDPDVLRAANQQEAEADFTRRILVGKLNRVLADLQDGDGEDETDGPGEGEEVVA